MLLHFADAFIPSTLSTFFGVYSSGSKSKSRKQRLSLWGISASVSPFYGTECVNSTGYPNKPFHGDAPINVSPKYLTGAIINLVAVWVTLSNGVKGR